MKKVLVVLAAVILSLSGFSNLIVGGNGWSDIFLGFEGYNIYGGIKNYVPLETFLGKDFLKMNLPITDIECASRRTNQKVRLCLQ